ncbi:hypothetical protein B0H66DRAFT_608752 [Apodospora peruviana]|uniref:Uncharacterized protein n=1 Tax=Apodospora peruviana TaxID=516989 RepID=A0AAE0HTA5_9PEZI|nr:hypothetical protein B0H66DRAFT_608752 [Apodospora peruviana]
MSLPDELHFWKQEAKRLEARVVPPDEHGRENVALDRAADQGQTNPAPEPVERDICADGDRVRENFHENPAPLSSQLRRRSSFNEIVFMVEVPQSQPAPVTSKLDEFLAAGPKKNRNWQKRREHLGLSEPKSVIQTFFQLISRTPFSITPSTQIRDGSSNVETLLKSYQGFVQILRQDTDRWEQITRFAILLLVCLCRVAKRKGLSPETVDQYMNNFLPIERKSTKGSLYLKLLRTSVLWPVRQAEGLRSWLRNRADEFFLLYGAPITTYRKLWVEKPLDDRADDRLKRTVEFKTKLETIFNEEEQDCTVSFSVPFLVMLIGRGQFSLADINNTFGTKLSSKEVEESIYNIFLKVECIWGFCYPRINSQDASSDQGDSESTASALRGKFQSLIYDIHALSKQLTTSSVPEPGEASTTRPQQVDPDQTGTDNSSEVLDVNHQAESGLRSDETIAQPLHNQPSRVGIATIGGGVIMGNLEQSAKRHGDSDTLCAASKKRRRLVQETGSGTIQSVSPSDDIQRRPEPPEHRSGLNQSGDGQSDQPPEATASPDITQNTPQPSTSSFTTQQGPRGLPPSEAAGPSESRLRSELPISSCDKTLSEPCVGDQDAMWLHMIQVDPPPERDAISFSSGAPSFWGTNEVTGGANLRGTPGAAEQVALLSGNTEQSAHNLEYIMPLESSTSIQPASGLDMLAAAAQSQAVASPGQSPSSTGPTSNPTTVTASEQPFVAPNHDKIPTASAIEELISPVSQAMQRNRIYSTRPNGGDGSMHPTTTFPSVNQSRSRPLQANSHNLYQPTVIT